MRTHWVKLAPGYYLCTSCCQGCRIETLREPVNGEECDGVVIAVDLAIVKSDWQRRKRDDENNT